MNVLSPGLLGAVALVLLGSGLSHLRDPAALRRGLAAHGVLPGPTHRPVAVLLTGAELVLGAVLLAALAGAPAPLGAGAAGAAALSTGFAAYLAVVLRRHPDEEVPCACGLGPAPVSGTAVARAGLLAVYAVAGALAAGGWVPSAATLAEVGVAVASALALAVATAVLPAARLLPRDARLLAVDGGLR